MSSYIPICVVEPGFYYGYYDGFRGRYGTPALPNAFVHVVNEQICTVYELLNWPPECLRARIEDVDFQERLPDLGDRLLPQPLSMPDDFFDGIEERIAHSELMAAVKQREEREQWEVERELELRRRKRR